MSNIQLISLVRDSLTSFKVWENNLCEHVVATCYVLYLSVLVQLCGDIPAVNADFNHI